MRLLHRLGHHVARRHLEVLALVSEERIFDEHPGNRAERLLPHVALVGAWNQEAAKFRFGRRFPGPELDAAVADQVERGDPFRDPRGMVVVGRQQYDSVPQPDALGALAARGEKDLRGGGMCVFLEKMMLDFPHVVDAESVGEFDLVERVLKQFLLPTRRPRTRELMLVEGAEFHDARCCSLVFAAMGELSRHARTGSARPYR